MTSVTWGCMILAVDVKYSEQEAAVAGVLFEGWLDPTPATELVTFLDVPAAYEPGQFYKRELPCILKLIEEYGLHPECIVVDGFVFLDGYAHPGLGKHLFDALGGDVPVVGVAKSRFKGIGSRYQLYRGGSHRPLYITSAGMELDTAKELIGSMHGAHRIPALLKRVDRLARALSAK